MSGIPYFKYGGNLNGHVPHYLNRFLTGNEFDHANKLLTRLFNHIKEITALAPAAPEMYEFMTTVTKCYYETKAFCNHVAPDIYYDYLPKIDGVGDDYKSISTRMEGNL